MRVQTYLLPAIFSCVLCGSLLGASADESRPNLMTPQDLTAVPARPADMRVE